MAALPKKKISRTRGKTRRAHNRASLTDLVKSTKFPGLQVPGRLHKYYESLDADDKAVKKAMGLKADKKAPTRKPKAATNKPHTTSKGTSAKSQNTVTRSTAPQKTTGGGK